MSPAPLMPPPLRPTAAEASARLHAAIDALPEYAVPCVADGHGSDWLSDVPEAIDRAKAACATCPLMEKCEEFAVASRASGVVLAGRRWHPRALSEARHHKTSPALAGANER